MKIRIAVQISDGLEWQNHHISIEKLLELIELHKKEKVSELVKNIKTAFKN